MCASFYRTAELANVISDETDWETSAGTSYPYLHQVEGELGVPRVNLIRVFEIERRFHRDILNESDPLARRSLYYDLYSQVLPLLNPVKTATDERPQPNSVRQRVLLFRRELSGKSVIDIGCGDGQFLSTLAQMLPHRELVGLDAAALPARTVSSRVRLIRCDVIQFSVERLFDVAFSNQVLEHIAPSDLSTHLQSIYSSLVPGGQFIALLPNRFWGPYDITRILDNTFTGKTQASGSHLNESSYTELLPLLKAHGFERLRTVLPIMHRLPILRNVRIKPWFNTWVESRPDAISATHLIRWHGRPLFQNPIILICRKALEGR